MLTHDTRFEELAVAPVKTTDVEVVKQELDEYGYMDTTPAWTSGDLLMEVKIDALGEMLGSVTKKATVKLIGIISGFDVGDIFQVRVGLYDDDPSVAGFNYISQGFFRVEEIDYDYDSGFTFITMYDAMWRASQLIYSETIPEETFTYPITVEDLALEVAATLNSELQEEFYNLPNAGHEIEEDLYSQISAATLQDVIQHIAGATGTTARLTDTTLNFVPFEVSSEELTANELRKLKIGETYGPVNSVVLGRVPTNDNIALSASNPSTDAIESVDTGTDLLTITDHGMPDGNAITLTSTGTLPAPLEEDTLYFVFADGAANTFGLTTSYNEATQSRSYLVFDGADDYVDADENITGLSDQLSVYWRGVINDRSNQQQLIGNRTDTGTDGFYLHKDFSSSKIRFGLGDGTNYQSWRTTTATDAFPGSLEGEVVEIVATYDAGTVAIYVNGVYHDVELYSGTAFSGDITDGAQTLRAGRYQTSSAYDLDGTIEEIRIWDYALDQDDVSFLSAGARPQSNSLILEWLFTEGTGTVVTDTSDTGNNGTITDAVWADNRQLIDLTSAGTGDITIPNVEVREIQINNNEILDDYRQELIEPLYNALNGLEWTYAKAKTIGLGWHEVGDVIQFTENSTTVNAFLNEVHLVLDGSLKENLLSEVPEVAAIDYTAAGGITKTLYNTEIKVDKQDQTITSIVSEQETFEEDTLENFTQVYQDIENIELTVQKAGGGNLLLNSVGYARESFEDDDGDPYDKLLFWDYNVDYDVSDNGSVTSYTSSESQNFGGISGQVVEMQGTDMLITQRIDIAVNTPMSFGIRVKNIQAQGEATITLSNDNETYEIVVDEAQDYIWEEFSIINFEATLPWFDVSIQTDDALKFMFSDLRLTYGTNLQGWVQANSEILSANVQFTKDGMRIFDSVHDTETRVTFNEFSTRRKTDGEVLFEADDLGVLTNNLTIKGGTNYLVDDETIIKQITIGSANPKSGLAFIKVLEDEGDIS